MERHKEKLIIGSIVTIAVIGATYYIVNSTKKNKRIKEEKESELNKNLEAIKYNPDTKMGETTTKGQSWYSWFNPFE